MILEFPSAEALRLALISGAVPEAVSLTPAVAGFDDQGRAWVRPSVALPDAALAELRRLRVQVRKTSSVPLDQPICCWPQLLAVRRHPAAANLSDRTPVLFELTEDQLPELVNEILRLGNDRQSFRQVTDGTETRSLLRVIGPPYYSLLRALDREGRAAAPRAYVEQSPRVWVEIGHVHPLAEQLEVPPGQLLLIRAPRAWTFVPEAKFRDIYEVLEFRLPHDPLPWHETQLDRRLTVPLRLARAGSAEPAELWVLRDQGLDQMDALVCGADNQLLARLAFAVGIQGEQRTVVLRVRPSRQPPPVLVLEGVGFRPYLRLPNLFLPCETRLHPPLRRDAVGKLLAADPRLVTWLAPHPDGTFTPESLPEDAFRPLADWVDYVLDRDHQALEAWAQATRFDFEPFVCHEEPPGKKPSDRPPRRGKPRDNDAPVEELKPPSAIPVVDKSRKRKKEDPLVEMPQVDPGEMQQRLHDLEERFLALAAPLDSPDRQALWLEMAPLNHALGHAGDATVCWVNALWSVEGLSPWSEAWLKTERTGAARPEWTAAELDAILAAKDPAPVSVRALAAYLAWAGQANQPVPELARRLGPVQHFLESQEARLPIRAAWLAWLGVVRLSGDDVLALARTRDRLLERLYCTGLSTDLDLPGFLRLSGLGGGDRLRVVREHFLRLHRHIRQWLAGTQAGTVEYGDLLFAYGLARLGENTEAQKILRAAQEALTGRDEVHTWLRQAYEYRIRQALEGRPPAGRLPDELLEPLGRMERLARYKVDRLREHSRILEPHEKIDPYRRWHGRYGDELGRELAVLCDLNDRAQLTDRLNGLLRGKRKWARVQAPESRILTAALELAPRLGESFARDLLERVEPVLDQAPGPLEQALLLEKGLFLAAHFDQAAHVQTFVARFHRLFEGQSAEAIHALEPLLGQCFHGLRKLGLRDDVGRLLERIAAVVLQGPTAPGSKPLFGRLFKQVAALLRQQAEAPEAADAGGRPVGSWPRTLKLLLQVAGGWFYFGQDDRAWPILDEVRDVLLQGDLLPVEQTALACAYVRTLGQAPIGRALPRLEELLRKVERIQDTFTTNTHYSLSRLDLVEAVVLALVSDDFALDGAGRRWLDEDEYLVRRRIHRDVRSALTQAGL